MNEKVNYSGTPDDVLRQLANDVTWLLSRAGQVATLEAKLVAMKRVVVIARRQLHKLRADNDPDVLELTNALADLDSLKS